MSTLLTARQIVERALRRIGAYSINDNGADPEHMREGLFWLDMMVAETAGVERMFGFTPDTIDVALTGGVQSYDLLNAMGANAPVNGVSFPVWCEIADDTGSRFPIAIVSRQDFESVSDLNQSGKPDKVYIDRLNTPTMKVHPVPATGVDTYTLKLVVQELGPDLTTKTGANLQTGFRAAWLRWAVLKLAYDLSSGAVLRMSGAERNEIKSDYIEAYQKLTDFENREHETTAPVADCWEAM